jgi:hypothetical protein
VLPCALNYGNRGLGRVGRSAHGLDTFVDKVLDYTGAKKVSIVGHSQGGMMPRYWTEYLGGKGKVEDLVGFAPSNDGTNLGKATSENSTQPRTSICRSRTTPTGTTRATPAISRGRFEVHKEAQRRRRHARAGFL